MVSAYVVSSSLARIHRVLSPSLVVYMPSILLVGNLAGQAVVGSVAYKVHWKSIAKNMLWFRKISAALEVTLVAGYPLSYKLYGVVQILPRLAGFHASRSHEQWIFA